MIRVNVGDTIRIDLGGGQSLTVAAIDVVKFVKRYNKSCPNHECEGGWLPDLLKTGEWKCPVCRTTWRDFSINRELWEIK